MYIYLYLYTYPNNFYTLMEYKRSTEEAAIMLLSWNNVQIKLLNKKFLNLVFETFFLSTSRNGKFRSSLF